MQSPLTTLFPPADKAAWRAQVQKDLKDPAAPDALRWQPDTSDRDTSDREPSDREPSDRDTSDRDTSDRDTSDRDTSDRDTSDRDTSDRDTSDRDTSDRDTSDRDTSDRDTSDRDTSDRDTSDRDTSDRDTSDHEAGFTLDPYYTGEDMTGLPLEQNQSVQKSSPGWLNAPAYELTSDPKADNKRLRDALSRGADALVVTLTDQADLPRLLDGLKLSETPVYFRLQSQADAFLNRLRPVTPYQIRGGILTDADTQTTLDALAQTADSPGFRTICLSSHSYHNAGATITQELAFLFGTLADRYDALTDAGLTVDALMPKTLFSVAIGPVYFMEIAKLRALRVLWSRFLAAYQCTQPIGPAFIHAQTSSFYEAAQSPYTNLLRATTEAMAAVIGGCDVLTVRPYTAVFGQSVDGSDKAHAERVARNVSILLKEESFLDKVADPSAGSYYIETLTQTLTEAAWALFLRIEAGGGLAKSADLVQSELDAAYRAKVNALKNGRVMVGVNKFQEGDVQSSSQPVTAENAGPGLPNRRLASTFE